MKGKNEAGVSGAELERLRTASYALSAELDSGWSPRVDALLEEIISQREKRVVHEVGRIVRQLHDALRELPIDARLSDFAKTKIPDVRARLNFVSTKTEEAANRTLEAVDTALPLSQGVGRRAVELSRRFERREYRAEEWPQLASDAAVFFGDIERDTARINACLSEALMAQEFQDITGQVIRRITEIVEGVEDHLLSLLQGHNGATEADTDAVSPSTLGGDRCAVQGPRFNSDDPNSVNGQDDVDDLLSSLGF